MREMSETSEWEGDREDVAAQALAALAGGSGEECGGCGAEIQRSGSGWACPDGCFRALCPVCGADCSDFNGCDHLLAAPDYDTGGWFYPPLDWDAVPRLAADADDVECEDEDEREHELFGAAAPLLRAFVSGYRDLESDWDLWDSISAQLTVPVLEESWASPMYYTPAPAAAHREIDTLLARLEEGFRRLAALRAARSAEREAAEEDEWEEEEDEDEDEAADDVADDDTPAPAGP